MVMTISGNQKWSERMNIVFGLPSPQEISYQLLGNVLSLISYTKQNVAGINEINYIAQTGVRTDRNRNMILAEALKRDTDYILWLDADMIYPIDMVVKYLKWRFDVLGCVYFKREFPYDAVPAVKNPKNDPKLEYCSIFPPDLPEDTVIEVDGLGFGGMMVNMNVYKTMGDDKWMNYGKNFHLPFSTTNRLSHDFQFCKDAQKYGFKIHLHTGVKPGHMVNKLITEDDWRLAHPTAKKTVKGVINNAEFIDQNVSIGDDCLISHEVVIYTHHHNEGNKLWTNNLDKTEVQGSLTIGNNVFIGRRAMILSSCHKIGNNVVIGAGAIVTKDIPDNVVVAGNPAKVINYRDKLV